MMMHVDENEKYSYAERKFILLNSYVVNISNEK